MRRGHVVLARGQGDAPEQREGRAGGGLIPQPLGQPPRLSGQRRRAIGPAQVQGEARGPAERLDTGPARGGLIAALRVQRQHPL